MHVVDFVAPNVQTQGRHFGDAVHVRVVDRADDRHTAINAVTRGGITRSHHTDSPVKDVVRQLLKLNAGKAFEVVVEIFVLVIRLNHIDELFQVGGNVARVV